MGTWCLQPVRQVTLKQDWTETRWWPPSRVHQDAFWSAKGSKDLQGSHPRVTAPERGGMWCCPDPWGLRNPAWGWSPVCGQRLLTATKQPRPLQRPSSCLESRPGMPRPGPRSFPPDASTFCAGGQTHFKGGRDCKIECLLETKGRIVPWQLPSIPQVGGPAEKT